MNFLRLIYVFLFNFKESLFHNISDKEISLINNCNLFKTIDKINAHEIVGSLRRVWLLPDQLIIKEGDKKDALYIIVSGSVRVFTFDSNHKKIALAMLNQGDYFGEQAFLGPETKTRNASIETINETVLLRIDKKFIEKYLQLEQAQQDKIKKQGYEQVLKRLVASTGFYHEFSAVLAHLDHPVLEEFSQGKVIFSLGDKSTHVYLILHGQVELIIPDKTSGTLNSVLYNKGHFFGELGVLTNKTRSGTAVVHQDAQLLIIPATEFKKLVKDYPPIQQMLSSLQHVYQLPASNTVEQYIGMLPNVGQAITNVFKLNDGRFITSSRVINQSIFTMAVHTEIWNEVYHYRQGDSYIELYTANNHLVKINATGNWPYLPTLCQIMINNESVEHAKLEQFSSTGTFDEQQLTVEDIEEKLVCYCMSVKNRTILRLIDQGIRDLDTLSQHTGACTVCRCCKNRILEMIGKNQWLPAKIKKSTNHNDKITSYLIIPEPEAIIPWKPGQHIILQANVNGNWVERAYTLSEIYQNKLLRITVKKEPMGYFTSWLFEKAPEEFLINISQPEGEFILDENEDEPLLCFAGNVGITPFISFAKALAYSKKPRKMRIIYCASNKKDFVLTDEFEQIVREVPSITISYRDTAKEGPLTQGIIANIVHTLDRPMVYICGSKGFEQFVHLALQSIQYDAEKIRSEQFIHPGNA